MSYGSYLLIFVAIVQAKHEKRKNHSMLAKSDHLNISKMVMKLCMLFDAAELIVLVQIPNATDEGQSEFILNVVYLQIVAFTFSFEALHFPSRSFHVCVIYC